MIPIPRVFPISANAPDMSWACWRLSIWHGPAMIVSGLSLAISRSPTLTEWAWAILASYMSRD